MRDYFKARLAEEERPSDFDAIIEEIEALYAGNQKSHSETEQEINLLIGRAIAVRLHFLLGLQERYCSEYPHGLWMPSVETAVVPDILRWAREFFASRDIGGEK